MAEVFADREGRLVEVASRKGGVVEFCPQGGGFVRRMPSTEFRRRFKPAPQPAYRAGRVRGDWMEEGSYDALLTDRAWNGWAMPYFEMKAALAVAHAMGGSYDAKRDAFVFGEGEEREEFAGVMVDADGRRAKAYPIGAGGWCWEAVE